MTQPLPATGLFEQIRHLLFTPAVLDQPAFPRADWERWRSLCRERWEYFTGRALEEEAGTGVKNAQAGKKYPLEINPIKSFVLKHAYTLFGEVPDRANALVRPRLIAKDRKSSEAKETARQGEAALERIYYESHMRSLMAENGVLAQFLGGCVFKASWQPPTAAHPSGVRVERVIPDFFWGVPVGSDLWDLREAWVIQPISAEDAHKVYNVRFSFPRTAPEVLLVEYWNREGYRVSIDGQTAQVRLADGNWTPLEGRNDIGRVPLVYIPHERAGQLTGLSLVDTLKNLEKEYNARMADAGDAVREEAKLRLVMSNVPQGVRRREIEPGVMAYDLGMTAPGAQTPQMTALSGGPRVTAEMNRFNDALLMQMRRDGFVPPVADGEDEGSQRSALTLAFRMWPLTAHIRAERQYWTEGLNVLDEMILALLAAKNSLLPDSADPAVLAVGPEHLGHMMRQEWAPMIPRDREQLVNEYILRAKAHHISPRTALIGYGDVDDVLDEIEEIERWLATVQRLSGAPASEPGAEPPEPAAEALTE